MKVRTELASGLKKPLEAPVQIDDGSTREQVNEFVQAAANASKAC